MDKINANINQFIDGSGDKEKLEQEIPKELGLDELNWNYFLSLLNQKRSPSREEDLILFDPNLKTPPIATSAIAYSTAAASADQISLIPYIDYSKLLESSSKYQKISKGVSLWLKKTQAGGGTSILRTKYLSKNLKKSVSDIKLGSKGTDLYYQPKSSGNALPLAEVQILQAALDMKAQTFHSIFYHDMVSSESQKGIQDIWIKKNYLFPEATNEELSNKVSGFHHFGETFQSVIPTLDEKNVDKNFVSLKRKAPGGHAFFAVAALLDAANPKNLPKTDTPLVCAIGNGEDLGSTPDANMIGWMIDNKIPIVMVTTEKTEIDLKGGQIAVVKKDGDTPYIALIEQAQAKKSGQIDLFEKLGLDIKPSGRSAFFNTNLVLINYSVLPEKIKNLIAVIGKDKFLKLITPTLIENKKEQIDEDGKARTYTQLEGAMGSTFLNLDRYWRANYNEPLVHFINVDRKNRTRFFNPIKTAFDFYMQFFSDRFTFEEKSMRLENLRPGFLPLVTLENPFDKTFYQEAQNVLDAFKDTKIRELDELSVSGPVNLSGVMLQGRVKIVNESEDIFNVAQHLQENKKGPILKNVTLHISKNHDIVTS